MNKQNTKTEATRNETLKKWTLETLCNIAILVSGHPEIEDDVLEEICNDVESVELAIHAYLKNLHPEPEAPLYKIEVIDINTSKAVEPPVSMPKFFTHKDTAYKCLKEWEDEIEKKGCIGIVRPVSKESTTTSQPMEISEVSKKKGALQAPIY